MNERERQFHGIFKDFPWVWGIFSNWECVKVPRVHNGELLGEFNFDMVQFSPVARLWIHSRGFRLDNQMLQSFPVSDEPSRPRVLSQFLEGIAAIPVDKYDVTALAISSNLPEKAIEIYRRPSDPDLGFKGLIVSELSRY